MALLRRHGVPLGTTEGLHGLFGLGYGFDAPAAKLVRLFRCGIKSSNGLLSKVLNEIISLTGTCPGIFEFAGQVLYLRNRITYIGR